jgi:N6-adenosine-specific RNA methylase IME4
MLPQALDAMAAWGFEYRSNFNWHKDRIDTGYWNRNRHEHLLVGTWLGNPPVFTGLCGRIYAAIFSFCAGVMPPIPILGRSLL